VSDRDLTFHILQDVLQQSEAVPEKDQADREFRKIADAEATCTCTTCV